MKQLLFCLILSVSAFGQLVTPSWRGEAETSHAEWDVFTEAKFAPNFPDVVADDNASLTCRTSSAFLTGGRNIYSFQAPLSMQLDDTTDLPIENVFLQIAALGSGIDAAGARLLVEDDEGQVTVILPSRNLIISEEELTGDRGGVGTIYGIQWDLRGSPMTGTYSILFDASESSLSLDRVSLDLSTEYQEVPKPQPLNVQVMGDEVRVFWFGNRRLQSSNTLDSDWVDVPGSDGVNAITLAREDQPTFFRLKAIEDPE